MLVVIQQTPVVRYALRQTVARSVASALLPRMRGPGGVCDAAAGAMAMTMAMTMQQHFPLSRLAHGNKKKRKEKEKNNRHSGFPGGPPP